MEAPMPDSGHARLRVVGVRSGVTPPLAEGFITRPETAPGLPGAVVPGSLVVLVNSEPGQPATSCGKSQLAVHTAEALWRSGRLELLAWIDARSRASVLTGYLQAAAALGIELAGRAEQVAGRFTAWLAATTRSWLLVLDDLGDQASIDGLWPRGPAGTVLITTRDPDALGGASSHHAPQVLPVGAFSTREALNYLMGRLSDDPDQRHGAIDLAIALDGDPCALAHASAVIAGSTWTCRDYEHQYIARLGRLAARQANGCPAGPVAATWLLSAERAERLAPGGATNLLLALMALMDGEPIPSPTFTTSAISGYLAAAGCPADADQAWEAVRALAHTGLVIIGQPAQASSPAGRARLVRLCRTTAARVRSVLPKQVFEHAAQAAADALLGLWPDQETQPWQAASLRACTAALQRTAGDRLWAGDRCHRLLLRSGRSMQEARLTGPSASHWIQIATASDKVMGTTHSQTLAAGGQAAHALLAAGQPGIAANWWQWLMAGQAHQLGPDHPDTLAATLNLGHALTMAGKSGDAIDVLEQAVAGYERVRGPRALDSLHAREELAAACQAAGKTTEAVAHYRHALAGRERAHGPHHPATLLARQKLASACLAAGRVKEAISGYKNVLSGRRQILGPDHLDSVAAQRSLAAAYQAAGKIAAALQEQEQVCAGYERALGAGHRDSLACRAELVDAYVAAGRLSDAATLLRDTLTRSEQALPPGDPFTATLRQALAKLAMP
jgi:tetratricopeptide (TPR) repeat protein